MFKRVSVDVHGSAGSHLTITSETDQVFHNEFFLPKSNLGSTRFSPAEVELDHVSFTSTPLDFTAPDRNHVKLLPIRPVRSISRLDWSHGGLMWALFRAGPASSHRRWILFEVLIQRGQLTCKINTPGSKLPASQRTHSY